MATSEALTSPAEAEDGQNTQGNTLEHEISDTQIKVEHAMTKRRYKICCAVICCVVIAAVIVVYAWWKTHQCGSGKSVCGDESLMDSQAHGTCVDEPQSPLRWQCDRATADRICCFNRDFAEYSGYWQSTTFVDDVSASSVTTFYDSITGKPLFMAPIGRSLEEFEKESTKHGWPSFRDDEVVWENVRVLHDGETVSLDGTHLGHNLPDLSGNRYCINLVSIAGYPLDP